MLTTRPAIKDALRAQYAVSPVGLHVAYKQLCCLLNGNVLQGEPSWGTFIDAFKSDKNGAISTLCQHCNSAYVKLMAFAMSKLWFFLCQTYGKRQVRDV